MHVVVQHQITDPGKFAALDVAEIAAGPPGTQAHQFFPSTDATAAICLWETDSIDELRGYLDPATAGVMENRYFEVDSEHALGLPATAAAAAQ